MKIAVFCSSPPRGGLLAGIALLLSSLTLTSGCDALNPTVSSHPNQYVLSGAQSTAGQARPRPPVAGSAPTLILSPPHAAAGFDSKRIIYIRQAGQLEYFAQNEWIDTPARMLAPLIVAAVDRSGAFRAVVQTPSTVAGDMRLDIEILRLQHEFLSMPSRVHFTIRAYLVDSKTRRVIASREFDASAPSASENPQGGVVAANQAVQTVLIDLSAFCAEVARRAPLE